MNKFISKGTRVNILFPKQIQQQYAKRPEKLLLLCCYDPAGVSTILEIVACLQTYSCFSVTVVNLFEHQHHANFLTLLPAFDLKPFDILVIHNSVAYNVDNLYSLDALLPEKIAAFPGIKILMKQDENFRSQDVAHYIGQTHFDVIFTCLPEEAIPLVYPKELSGDAQFVRMLTGYVTPTLRQMSNRLQTRSIDIGYRGSIQPLSFGRLAYEKRKIGEDVQQHLAERGLALDISSRWEDRLGVDEWFNFLSDCKAVLGTESGGSIFDFNHELDARVAKIEANLGPFREDSAYAEAYLAGLADLEDKVFYNQISPRHFEAAATHTLQVMYPGRYSDILIAGKHFVELQRDYSNLDEIVAFILDDKKRQMITDCVFEEIIQSPTYWIETFIETMDALILEKLEAKSLIKKAKTTSSKPAKNVVILSTTADVSMIDDEQLPPEAHLISLAPLAEQFDASLLLNSIFPELTDDSAAMTAFHTLWLVNQLATASEAEFCDKLSAPYDHPRNAIMRSALTSFFEQSTSMLQQLAHAQGVHGLIAIDLPGLCVGLILQRLYRVPLYIHKMQKADAELEYETQWWNNLEKRLLHYMDSKLVYLPKTDAYFVTFDALLSVSRYNSANAERYNKELQEKARRERRFLPRLISYLKSIWMPREKHV